MVVGGSDSGKHKADLRKFSLARVLVSAVVALLLLCAVGVVWYVNDYYHAAPEALEALGKGDGIDVEDRADCIVFEPENPVAGFVFYPGGKVQAESYAPLMRAFAEHDVLCVLVKMPFNLAIFDKDAADRYVGTQQFDVPWYVGGHSLGGVMAASYAAERADKLEGVVCLAAYPAVDLSESSLSALSVYGSNDGVLNMDTYRQHLKMLPPEQTELVIEGGNHSGFGAYGPQEGDGQASIPASEQQEQTAEALSAFCER